MNEENKNLVEEIGKRFDEKTEETKRHMSVLVEETNGKIDLLAEGQSALQEKFDLLEIKLGEVKNDTELLKEDMDYVKSEIVEIKDRFEETDKKIEKKAEKGVVSDHAQRIFALESEASAKA